MLFVHSAFAPYYILVSHPVVPAPFQHVEKMLLMFTIPIMTNVMALTWKAKTAKFRRIKLISMLYLEG